MVINIYDGSDLIRSIRIRSVEEYQRFVADEWHEYLQAGCRVEVVGQIG